MARTQILTNNGETQYREARANGTSAVTVKAGASLAADIDFILPVALPVAQEFLAIDSAGQISTAAGATGTLDEAYDSGGAGNGRIITSDTGPVEAAGAGGFLASHTAPVYGLETTGAEHNYRLTAGQTADIFEIQRGDQDGDISADTFDVFFALDGPNLRMGLNTVAPGTTAELVDAAASKLTLQSAASNDVSVIFDQAGTSVFEIGYDDSAGGLVVGLVDFTAPFIFVEDSTGRVALGGDVTPQGHVDITVDGSEGAALFMDASAGANDVISVLHQGTGIGVDSSTASGHAVRGIKTGAGASSVANFEQNNASGTAPALRCLQTADVDVNTFVKTGTGAGDMIQLSNAGTGPDINADNWSVAKIGDASFGASADSVDHFVTIMAGSVTDNSVLNFADVGANSGQIDYDHNTDYMLFTTGGVARVRIRTEGVQIGTGTGGSFTGVNNLFIANGTPPSASVTSGVTLYSEDVAASAELHVRDEADNITVLSPHTEVDGHKLSEDMAWSFYSKRAGKYVWVDMLRVVRLLEKLTGEELAFMGEAA